MVSIDGKDSSGNKSFISVSEKDGKIYIFSPEDGRDVIFTKKQARELVKEIEKLIKGVSD